MQGQFRKNFRRRGRGRGSGSRPRGRDARSGPRGAPRGRAASAPHAFPSPVRPPPGTSRHGTGPSTTFGRHPPTMASRAKIKPQVDGLRFSRNTGYGRGVGAKRSRWAGFAAETIPGTRLKAFGSGQSGYLQENVAVKKKTGQTYCLTC